MLAVISSQTEVNIQDFKDYCLTTARMYAQEYDWYHMSTAVHISLIHGYLMLKRFPNHSSGDKSEEPLEASHKLVKYYRTQNARKTSR